MDNFRRARLLSLTADLVFLIPITFASVVGSLRRAPGVDAFVSDKSTCLPYGPRPWTLARRRGCWQRVLDLARDDEGLVVSTDRRLGRRTRRLDDARDS